MKRIKKAIRKGKKPGSFDLDPLKIDLVLLQLELPGLDIGPLETLDLGDLKLDLPELKIDPLPEFDLKPLKIDLEPLDITLDPGASSCKPDKKRRKPV